MYIYSENRLSNKKTNISDSTGSENILKNKPHSFQMTKVFRVTNVLQGISLACCGLHFG